MGTDQSGRNRARMLDRRAARARRSRWLGRLLFSLTGMGLLLVLRTHPHAVADVVAWSHGGRSAADTTVPAGPPDIRVRAMPSDSVPVRRGGTLAGTGAAPQQDEPQARADDLGAALRGLNPGG